MPLSEYESRVLEQLEHDFTVRDPDLSRVLASGILPVPSARGAGRFRFASRWRRAQLLLSALAIALMALGAVLVGAAGARGVPALSALAGLAYAGGFASLVGWQRRRSDG